MSYPDDDSCPRCGHLSGDGLPHSICPVQCSVCGNCFVPFQNGGCVVCKVDKWVGEMTVEEKFLMKAVLDEE